LGANTSVDRAVKELEPYDDWCSTAVESRQAALTALARKVWDLPEPVISLVPIAPVVEHETDLATGGYRPGSAIYDLFKRLSDQQWHSVTELEKITAGRADFDSRLARIRRRGKHRNLWILEELDGSVRIQFSGYAAT
jgi:hypothetical protein